MSAEDEEAANTIQDGDNIIDDPDYNPSTIRLTGTSSAGTSAATLMTQSVSSVPPPPLITDDTKNLREQLQKQKDMQDCFGFRVSYSVATSFIKSKTLLNFD